MAQTSGSYSEFMEEGMASWYGPGFHGRKTASGETFNTNELTAAHKSLPFNTLLRVTNLENGRYTIVRVNDRGPYARGRIIDLSYAAKIEIGMSGLAKVKIEIVKPDNQQVPTEDYSILTLFENAITKTSKVFIELKDQKGYISSLKIKPDDKFRKVLSTFKKVKVIVDNNNSVLNSIPGSSSNDNLLKYIDLTDKIQTFTGYSIQVMEFKNESDANDLIGKLESLKFNDVILVELVNGDSVNFKVFVGYYENENDAKIDMMNIKEMNFDAKVVRILS
ncbi:MAG: septal ring lytic transglycosylase RlpA family protein [Ignavibacteria bacterium]|nr:septal ring lytic transglycosylase RlpA family protein [Ignavibacteria bacterium]